MTGLYFSYLHDLAARDNTIFKIVAIDEKWKLIWISKFLSGSLVFWKLWKEGQHQIECQILKIIFTERMNKFYILNSAVLKLYIDGINNNIAYKDDIDHRGVSVH